MENQWFNQLQEKRRRLSEQLNDPAAVGFWRSVVDKYSESAHFVYELLQNSDDACATEVRILLRADFVEYTHNGRPFTLSDPNLEGTGTPVGNINAITSIGASSKRDGNSIGKFGMGFKSVYQYTHRPHIEDDEFCFDIEDYIVPVGVPRQSQVRKKGDTSFIFPIDRPEVNIPLIEEKLSALHHPLLFLPHLKRIVWTDTSGKNHIYEKEVLEYKERDGIVYQRLQVLTGEKLDFYHQFCQQVPEVRHSISCVFQSDEMNNLLPMEDEPLFCYFPTKEHVPVRFILHAPFLLTESRETVKRDNEWNDRLMRQLGELVIRSLEMTTSARVEELLSLSDTKCWLSDSPFFQSMLSLLPNAKIFPADDSTFVSLRNSFYPEDRSLRRLFSSENVQQMLLLPNKWILKGLDGQEESHKKKVVETMTRAGLLMVSIKQLLPKLSPDFLEKKSITLEKNIAWWGAFYTYLNHVYNHISGPKSGLSLKNIPLILCSDGKVRPAYANGRLNVFFSSVHPQLLEQASCTRFLESLGVTEQGSLKGRMEQVLSSFQNGTVDVEDQETIADYWNILLDYFLSLPFYGAERDEFIEGLKGVPFLLSVDRRGRRSFLTADRCYFRNRLLSDLLGENPLISFFENKEVQQAIAPERRDDFYQLLTLAGLHFGLNIKSVLRESSPVVMDELHLHPQSLRQQDNGAQVIEDRMIEGLDNVEMTPSRSSALFQLLSEELKRLTSYLFRVSLEGKYTYYEKGKRTPTEERITQTSAKRFLFQTPWLYGKDGTLYAPNDVTDTSHLADIYDLSSNDVLFLLNIKLADDMKLLTATQREALALVNKFKAKGMTIGQMEQVLEKHCHEHEHADEC